MDFILSFLWLGSDVLAVKWTVLSLVSVSVLVGFCFILFRVQRGGVSVVVTLFVADEIV